MRKLTCIAAALIAAGLFTLPAPAQAAAATPKSAKAAEVKDELKELKAALEALHAAKKAHDKPGEKAAAANVLAIWRELPPHVRERVEKNHPELAKRIHHLEKDTA